MKRNAMVRMVFFLLYCLPIFPGLAQKPIKLSIHNPSGVDRKDVLVKIPYADFQKLRPGLPFGQVKAVSGKVALSFQWNDSNRDGQPEELAILTDLPANGRKMIFIRPLKNKPLPVFEKRTQAELSRKVGGAWEGRVYKGGTFQNVSSMRVPPEHTDHSFFIRYEGPGWESDKVGYRFYLDWRNAMDIFGKTGPQMVLQDVGQDGFDSYHEFSSWGMDVLKVGESLGIGSLGFWNQGKAQRVDVTDSLYCEIALNGPIESMVRTIYSGWKAGNTQTTVTSELSIAAGSHLTHHSVHLSSPLDNLCTGIVKLPDTELFWSDGESGGKWGYMATFGKQSLNNDLLGMAIFYRKADLKEKTADAHSHVVVLKPESNQLEYYFLGAWEKEPDGFKTKASFQNYLETLLGQLNNPVGLSFN
ncbi:MAG: DUF4861 domain-containing protein [Haliscomenobacter sp.]|nr:DUF4861 domain-containing protein [Haliscomenobacter sp.]